MRRVRLRQCGKWIASLAFVLGLFVPAMVAASLSEGFATASPIPAGSLVSLDAKASGTVVVADLNTASRLFGVAVPPTASSLSLSSGSGQVQVATTGTAMAFVSTAGGDIKVGDYIAVSPLAGVGMKANGPSRVIGTAQTDFNASSTNTTKQTIEDSSGKHEVTVGEVPLQIAVTSYNHDSANQAMVPSWLQSLSNTLAGKIVSPIRVVIAGLILIVALVSATALLYSAVRNSIISIGRNPLSRGSVLRGLAQVLVIVAAILAASAGGMYLVITK